MEARPAKINLLSVIIARKGSKGLPTKCMLPIGSMPTVEYTMRWASSIQESWLDHTVVISTDIEELQEISKKYNLSFIRRPDYLCEDKARVEDVVFHAVTNFNERDFDYISLCYGNIPLRYDELLLDPLLFLEKHPDMKGVLTFQNVEKYNPAWMVEYSPERLPTWTEKGYRRQDLRQYMIHDGHTCIVRYDHFIDSMIHANDDNRPRQMYWAWGGSEIRPWIHDKLVIDIDTEKDYILARCVLEKCMELF